MSAGVPSEISLPRLTMSTRLHIFSTSDRMWVERMTVRSFPCSRITFRIWRTWLGSRPIVGSSRITISGSCTMASAMPMRW
jgi:hypothetical protein